MTLFCLKSSWLSFALKLNPNSLSWSTRKCMIWSLTFFFTFLYEFSSLLLISSHLIFLFFKYIKLVSVWGSIYLLITPHGTPALHVLLFLELSSPGINSNDPSKQKISLTILSKVASQSLYPIALFYFLHCTCHYQEFSLIYWSSCAWFASLLECKLHEGRQLITLIRALVSQDRTILFHSWHSVNIFCKINERMKIRHFNFNLKFNAKRLHEEFF